MENNISVDHHDLIFKMIDVHLFPNPLYINVPKNDNKFVCRITHITLCIRKR